MPNRAHTPAAALSLLLLVTVASACKKDEPKLSAADCAKLDERLVDLAVKEVLAEKSGAAAAVSADDLKKELAKDPKNAEVAVGCEKTYTRAVYDCMMQASTTRAAEACAN